jgi:formylmethanofuran dehydrogenase subunit C
MTLWTLRARDGNDTPQHSIDGSVISCARFAECDNIAAITTTMGSSTCRLSDWFDIEESSSPSHEIHIVGDCRWLDRLAAAEPGTPTGARAGRITVHGSIGHLAGHRMRRGELIIDGDVGDFLGAKMIAGTIIVTGRLGRSPLSSARRGTLIYQHRFDWHPDRFSRPMRLDFPYASLIETVGCSKGVIDMIDRARRNVVEVRRGDRNENGQAEVVFVDR